MIDCVFCRPHEILLENHLAWARYDKFPVSPGHLLIITRRHVADFFDSTPAERLALQELLEQCRALLIKELQPDGFNIGVNCGAEAGQTIMHLHIHLIPRFKGDMENPRGGVRGVIPGKQNY